MDSLNLPISPIGLADPLGEAFAAKLAAHKGGAGAEAAEKVAKDFESILIYKLLEEMKRTIPESGLLDDGVSQQIQDMFWYHLAEELADKGGFGIWKQLLEHTSLAAAVSEAPKVETEG